MTAVEGPVRRHGIRLVAASPTFHRAKAALSESKSGAFSVQKRPFQPVNALLLQAEKAAVVSSSLCFDRPKAALFSYEKAAFAF